MEISINLTINDSATKDQVGSAIMEAAGRAALQLGFEVLEWPIEVDVPIDLGDDIPAVERATLFRSD